MALIISAGAEEILRKEGRLISAIRGDSMLPMLDENKDTVSLVPVRGELKKYDLPLYRRPNGKLVLHRIIKVRKKYYVTCGDNRTVSEKVPKEWVIAVCDGYFKDGKSIPADDGEYLKYVHKHCRGRWRRKTIQSPAKSFSDEEKNAVAGLLRAAVTGKTDMLPDPEAVDMERVFRLSKMQALSAALYPVAAKLLTSEKYGSLRENWQKSADMALRRDILTDAEMGEVFREFDRLGISYIPLKGAVLKKLWKTPGMREYSDVDVLIDRDKSAEARQVMEKRGYTLNSEGQVHDTYYRAPVYNFELHKRLFEDENAFGGVFAAEKIMERSTAAGDGTSRRLMNGTDTYVFAVAHLFKHWSSKGAGLRNYADLWLLKNQLISDGVGEDTVRQALQVAGLLKFENEAFDVCDAVFGEKPSKLSKKQMEPILGGGVYGTHGRRVVTGVAKRGKVGYFIFRAFPPVREISYSYPVLKKAPVLLPVCWIHRWASALLYKRSRIGGEMKIIARSGADPGDGEE